ncbi:MAG: ethanolamine utilization protein EutH [Mycoplasmatales bacterium]
MGINDIILYIMVFFMIVGGLDKLFGNKFGYGEKFEEGIMAMGALCLAMVGIIVIAPVLADIMLVVITPLSEIVGNDPSVYAGMLLANDMGGYQLAQKLAASPEQAMFSGLILASMFGPTLVFSIPIALGIIEKEDHKYLARGVLVGITTIPIGVFFGGLVAGFPIMDIIINLIPVIVISLLIVVGLKLMPEAMINGFSYFGKGVVILATLGLMLGIFQQLTGITLIEGTAPITDGLEIIGAIAIVLAGAFPMVHFITKTFSKQLEAAGKKMGMNDVAAAGLIATLANNITTFGMLKDMNTRGKLINIAFLVSASFVIGDHLGFTAGVEASMIFPMIVGKFVGGISAIIVMLMTLRGAKDVND